MPAGRPPKFKKADDMQVIINEYFAECTIINDNGQSVSKPTMAGLAYALDMSRVALCDYSKKDEFLYTLKRARLKVEMALEANLYNNSVTGTIFNLKNNFGWRDKSEQDITSGGEKIKNDWHIHPTTSKGD